MNITIYGTRGSYPVARKEMMRYGGNTTCFLVESGKDLIIVDAGTGIRKLGQHFINKEHTRSELNLFLTHPHWDHVLGFPTFSPLHDSRFHIRIYGADTENKKIENVFSAQYTPGNYPISYQQLPASIEVNKLVVDSVIKLTDTKVSCYQLNHPGINLGYRFESQKPKKRTFCVLHDLAPIKANYLGIGMADKASKNPADFEKKYYDGLLDFIKGSDLVLFDTDFTEKEIEGKRHWGHSTPQEALRLLSNFDEPPVLVLSHHDPNHTDTFLDEFYADSRREGKKMGIEVLIAKETGVFTI